MAEAAVNFALETLGSFLKQEIELLGSAKQEAEDMEGELESIKAFLKDADARAAAEEQGGESNEGHLIWVKQVREVAFRIENAIYEFSFTVAQFQHGSGPIAVIRKINLSLKKQKLRREFVKEIQNIKSSLAQIKRRAESYQQCRSIGQGSNSGTTYGQHDSRVCSRFIEDHHVVGFDSTKEKLIDVLVKGKLQRSVIAVVGQGGLGKTTLAGRIYDDRTVVKHFEYYRVWITVGKESSKTNLLRSIVQKFHCSTKREIKEMQEDELLSTLDKHLEKKRYMVVFDDVWPIRFWQCVEQALPDHNVGSRVMITTRNMGIAKVIPFSIIHQPDPLSLQEAMELFSKKTFGVDACCPPRLEKLSESIVEKCGKLPLAIVVVGGLLSNKDKTEYEWRKFSNGLSSKLKNDPHLKSSCTNILSNSYYDLPFHIRSCVLYFGLFPYNYSISCGRLMRLWIAEGLVEYEDNQTLEEVAEKYLIELIDRSLVQVVNRDISGRIRSCKVHGLMYEIILQKTKGLDFCRVLKEEREENSSLHSSTTQRISIHKSTDQVTEIVKGSKIRAVLLFDNLPDSVMSTFIGDFKLLKVLDFQNSSLGYLPQALGKLFHLHYLNLRNTEVEILPKSIGKLVNLETLDLKMSRVKNLPAEIKNLKKLRYLRVYNLHIIGDVIGTGRGITIQKGFGTLTDLQKLYFVRADTEVLKELMMLRKLRKLGITLTNGSGKYLCDFIEKMEHLESLIVDSTSRKEVIDIECMSSPPRYLQRLCLMGTMKKMPIWIRELEDLNRIDLDLSGLSEDPISVLHSLPNLLELTLKDTYYDKHLHFKDGWFPKLQQLNLLIFRGLESVTIDKGAMPDLRHLEIGPSPLLQDNITGIEHLGKLEGFKSIYKLSSTVMGKYLRKTVLKVALGCNKCRSKALKIAVAMDGVMSVTSEGEDRDRLAVIGDGYDPVTLVIQMRKKFGQAELLAVEMITQSGTEM